MRLTIRVFLVLAMLPCAFSANAGTMEERAFESRALGSTIKANVYRPDSEAPEGGWPVVYLLHGLGGSEASWPVLGQIEATLDDMIAKDEIDPVLVVMPGAGNSWYVDSREVGGPGDYATAISRDLVEAVEAGYPVRRDQGGRAIAGLSMGGAGALRLSLNDPHRYVAAAAMSPAIWQNIPPSILVAAPEIDAKVTESTYFHREDMVDVTEGIVLPPPPPHFGSAFGTPFDPQRFNRLNVFTLLAERIAAKDALPAIFLTVGDDDSHKLWRGAIAFYETMQADAQPVEFRVTDGDHVWELWRVTVRDALRFIDGKWREVRAVD